jgi:hypothetical protein
MENIIEFLNYCIDSLSNFSDNSDTYWEGVIIWLTITFLEIKTAMIEIAYSIASSYIAAIGISDAMNAAWSSVGGDMMAVLSYLRIPESINMILSAFITRFVLGILP